MSSHRTPAAILSTVLLPACGLFNSAATAQTTITVCPSGCNHTSIQSAIDAAANGDVISIAAGVYNEVNLNPGGKAITIQGTLNGDGSLATTIDATGAEDFFSRSVFTIATGEGADTKIKDLVVTGGRGTGLDPWGEATAGGGFYCEGSSPTISGCTITGNSVSYEGGGIYCWNSSPTINRCTINGNSAGTASAANGGGIFGTNNSNFVIHECTISDNTARKGGGIHCLDGTLTISDSSISNNDCLSYGGGIYCSNSSVTMSNCVILGNNASSVSGHGTCPRGAGIYNSTGPAMLLYETEFASNVPDTIVGAFNIPGSSSSTGACCLGGTCVTTTQSDCDAAGGTYAGDDVACTDAECATSCPADTNRDGSVDGQDLAAVLANWGLPCEE